MSNDEYVKHVWQIHEWMRERMDKTRDIVKADMDFQRIWSDRFIGANAKDYMSLLEKIAEIILHHKCKVRLRIYLKEP